MAAQGILQNRRFIRLVSVLAAAIALYILLIVFSVGGEWGMVLTKDIASVVFSLLAFWSFFTVWLSTDHWDVSRRIWGAFMVGLLLWMIAETVWAWYEIVLKVETPYPSLADLFWVLGYVPLVWGLAVRYRTLEINLSRSQKTVILILIGSLFLLTARFVFLPIISGFDPARLGEDLLNVFYPLSDLVLLIFTGPILFSFGKGRFALTWSFVISGFIVESVADLFFSSLSWYGLYYPAGRTTVMSVLVDVSFNLSYILLCLGIYAYSILLDIRHVVKLNAKYGALEGSKILVFIDPRNRIISASRNLARLTQSRNKTDFEKRYLYEILGMDEGALNGLIEKLKAENSIGNHIIKIGNPVPATLVFTAIALRDSKNQYDGAAIVLQTEPGSNENEDLPLTEEQTGLVESFLKTAGASNAQEALALKGYFQDQISLLYELAYEFNGQQVANSLLSFISQKAHENGWEIQVDGNEISIPAEYGGQLSEIIVHLLQIGRSFVANVVSLGLVDKEMKRIDQQLKPDVLRIIDRNGLRITSRVAF